jgi:hypothetical protein
MFYDAIVISGNSTRAQAASRQKTQFFFSWIQGLSDLEITLRNINFNAATS